MEKPIFWLKNADEISTAQLSDQLFGGKFRVIGNLSEWAQANPERYAEARSIAQREGRVGESPEQRADRHRRESVVHQPEGPMSEAEELELAAAIQAFPREKCRELFIDSGASAKLPPAEYRQAQLAGQFFDIVGKHSDTSSVKFNYPRHAKPDIQKPLDETPAGLSKSPDGIGYVISDPKAYHEWRELQAARKTIAEAK